MARFEKRVSLPDLAKRAPKWFSAMEFDIRFSNSERAEFNGTYRVRNGDRKTYVVYVDKSLWEQAGRPGRFTGEEARGYGLV